MSNSTWVAEKPHGSHDSFTVWGAKAGGGFLGRQQPISCLCNSKGVWGALYFQFSRQLILLRIPCHSCRSTSMWQQRELRHPHRAGNYMNRGLLTVARRVQPLNCADVRSTGTLMSRRTCDWVARWALGALAHATAVHSVPPGVALWTHRISHTEIKRYDTTRDAILTCSRKPARLA